MPHKPEDKTQAGTLRRALGARVREAREARRWSQEMLAEKIGVGTAMLGRYERGAQFPSHVTLLRLAEVLEQSTDALYGVPLRGAGARGDGAVKLYQSLEQLSPSQRQAIQGIVREFHVASRFSARRR